MTTDKNRRSDEAPIRSVIEDRAAALRAKNAAGVVRHHAPDFVQYSLAPPLVSTAADPKGLDAWFSTWRGPLGYEMHDLTITAGEDVAFCHSLNRLSGTKIDGEKSDIWFRHTLGFHKIGGGWKITHEHESVPFYMDGSLRAAVDLKP
jgi:ketosteroid isomerase-like protein